MMKSKLLLLAGLGFSALVWVACSSDVGTGPAGEVPDLSPSSHSPKTELDIKIGGAGGKKGAATSLAGSGSAPGAGIAGASLASVGGVSSIEDLSVVHRTAEAKPDGCVLGVSVDGQDREVHVWIDPERSSLELRSKDAFGRTLWLEKYEVLDEYGDWNRVSEIGPNGIGLEWTREKIGDQVWRESFSALGIFTPSLDVLVDYKDPVSISEAEVLFGEWLPQSVRVSVYDQFEGFAAHAAIVGFDPAELGGSRTELASLVADAPAARSVVEKICIVAGLCTGLKCRYGGGISNSICNGCAAVTIACSICDLLGLGC